MGAGAAEAIRAKNPSQTTAMTGNKALPFPMIPEIKNRTLQPPSAG
jgi:hypothetical protein